MTPLAPPRKRFADTAHYASFLALLDAQDRLRIAEEAPRGEICAFYAYWARRAAARGQDYLRGSRVARRPAVQCRPEYGTKSIWSRLETIGERAERVERGGLAAMDLEPERVVRMPSFCLVFGRP